MDEIRGFPTTLDVLYGHYPGTANGGGPSRPGPSKPSDDPRSEFSPLVEEDGLFVRIQPRTMAGTSFDRRNATKQPDGATEHIFFGAFREVWSRMPTDDGLLLLEFWRSPRDWGVWRQSLPTAPYRPLIDVRASALVKKPEGTCSCFGYQLTFTTAPKDDQLGRLSPVIALGLARVFMLAARTHWGISLKMVDEPLERWEQTRKREITDDQWDRKLDKLEAAYDRRYNRELRRILRGWGYKDPRLSKKV